MMRVSRFGLKIAFVTSVITAMITTFFLLFTTNSKMTVFMSKMIRTQNKQTKLCPGYPKGELTGRWQTRPLTAKEDLEFESFVKSVRGGNHQPDSIQRKDGKCGNVTDHSVWFRAMCNPKGPTPCCYEYQCAKKGIEQCKCRNCYDLRVWIKAEFAKWIPDDPRCEVKDFSPSALCDILHNKHIIFVGDSLMRHFYIGMLIVMANYNFDLVLKENSPEAIRKNCSGMNIFGEKYCRWTMRRGAKFCNGSTSLGLMYFYRVAHKHGFQKYVRLSSGAATNITTIYLVSLGIHENFNKKIYDEFMLPAIEKVKNVRTTKLIWATMHRLGIVKSLYKLQINDKVEEFNDYMKSKLQPHNIPILDTYNLTDGVASPDGTHFGMGINVMKAKMFINMIKHLKDSGHW